MIRPTHRCVVCGRSATREVLDRPMDNGISVVLHLCRRCPDPQQIDAAAARVRKGWSDERFYAKHFGCSIQHVEYRQQIDFRDIQCTIGRLDGRVGGREAE